MQIGERAALMFTAICRDLDRVFQRVGLLRPGLICSDQRADTDNKVACSKVRSGQIATGRCYGRNPPTGGSGCPGLRDFPEEIKAIIEQKGGADPNCRLWWIANMAIRQSAPERRALTISVSVPLSSWPGNLPGPARTSADLCCPASPALPVPAILPTP
jgi:hypothetical protein